jgi:DNA-binding NarL/FixJ family response regulator
MRPNEQEIAKMLKVGSARGRHSILIVDDHPIFREGLVQSINREHDLVVCGEAESAPQALQLVGQARPDLVIADITLPGKSGLELIKDFRALFPDLPVLAVSMHDESLYASRILRAGARGYVMKQETPQTLLKAIRHVLEGGIYVSESMSAFILESFSGRHSHAGTSPVEQLSDREFEIFHLIGQGHNNQDIAAALHLSLKTVAVHQANIRKKLQLRSGAELIRFAVRWEEAQGEAG